MPDFKREKIMIEELTPEQAKKTAQKLLDTGCTYQGRRLAKLSSEAAKDGTKVTISGKDEHEAWEFVRSK